MVRLFGGPAVPAPAECVVIGRTGGTGGLESISDFKALDRSDGENGLCQGRVVFLENRLTDSGRKSIDHTPDYAAR